MTKTKQLSEHLKKYYSTDEIIPVPALCSRFDLHKKTVENTIRNTFGIGIGEIKRRAKEWAKMRKFVESDSVQYFDNEKFKGITTDGGCDENVGSSW